VKARWIVLGIVVCVVGCKRPPEAPETLDELCAYLYEHHVDDEPEWTQAGLDNLDRWLDSHWDEMDEGYEVTPLTQEVTNSLDGQERPVEGMFGVTVGAASAHPADDLIGALLQVDHTEIAPDHYNTFDRTYHTDLACFLDRSCLRLETTEVFEGVLALGVTSLNTAYNQYLWVEIEPGWAMVQRSWLVEPPEINIEWLEVKEQFYLNTLLPDGDTTAACGYRPHGWSTTRTCCPKPR
jgi:hypothetical protein